MDMITAIPPVPGYVLGMGFALALLVRMFQAVKNK